MNQKILHFSPEELAERRTRAVLAMQSAGLDGLLIFKQESRYYLTGYDTGAHTYFQCLYLGGDGAMTLLCRLPDVRQARFTSVIEDIRFWSDAVDAQPGRILRDILSEHGKKGARLGVDLACFGMTARVWQQLTEACDGFCRLDDTSHLIDRLRARKSAAELAYLQQAAQMAHDAIDRGQSMARPGIDTGDILAALQTSIYAAGGQAPASNALVASGAEQGLLNYHSGRRRLQDPDQLQLRVAGVMRRYHATAMHTVGIGIQNAAFDRRRAACENAFNAVLETCRIGTTLGELYAVYTATLSADGYAHCVLDRCGHGLGATYAPTAVDWPVIRARSEEALSENMVFYLEVAVVDVAAGAATAIGDTLLITDQGPRFFQ